MDITRVGKLPATNAERQALLMKEITKQEINFEKLIQKRKTTKIDTIPLGKDLAYTSINTIETAYDEAGNQLYIKENYNDSELNMTSYYYTDKETGDIIRFIDKDSDGKMDEIHITNDDGKCLSGFDKNDDGTFDSATLTYFDSPKGSYDKPTGKSEELKEAKQKIIESTTKSQISDDTPDDGKIGTKEKVKAMKKGIKKYAQETFAAPKKIVEYLSDEKETSRKESSQKVTEQTEEHLIMETKKLSEDDIKNLGKLLKEMQKFQGGDGFEIMEYQP